MCIPFEVIDYLLPVGCENVFVCAVKSLVDLLSLLASAARHQVKSIHLPMRPCKTPRLGHSLAPRAVILSVDTG